MNSHYEPGAPAHQTTALKAIPSSTVAESWLLIVVSTVMLTVFRIICFWVQGSVSRQVAVRQNLSVSGAGLSIAECPLSGSPNWSAYGRVGSGAVIGLDKVLSAVAQANAVSRSVIDARITGSLPRASGWQRFEACR
jgi:hypothetical protein